MVIANILIAFNLLVLAALLFFRKSNALPNKVLAWVIFIPALNFANNILILTDLIYHFPYAYFIVQATAILYPPLVYYYILLITGKKVSYRRILFALSVLLACFVGYMTWDFAQAETSAQLAYLDSIKSGPYPMDMEIYSLLFFILQLVYFSFGAWEIRQYRNTLKNTLSDLESTKYTYLKYFISLFWGLTAMAIILYATIDTLWVEYLFLPIAISLTYVFILYCVFHFHAVFTTESFHSARKMNIALKDSLQVNGKEPKEAALFPENLPQEIILYIHEHQAYKDSDLTVQKLAEKFNFPSYQVSKAINHGLQTNFYDLVNKTRVEEAQTILTKLDQYNLSVEGVAYEVGFNSRTAFYRAFKKYTGKNPSDLIEK